METPLTTPMRDALRGMLSHACVTDAAPDDVDEEDRQLERAARAALRKANEALGEKA